MRRLPNEQPTAPDGHLRFDSVEPVEYAELVARAVNLYNDEVDPASPSRVAICQDTTDIEPPIDAVGAEPGQVYVRMEVPSREAMEHILRYTLEMTPAPRIQRPAVY
jgi:hypothetical protein